MSQTSHGRSWREWSKWVWAAIVVCAFVLVAALSSLGWVVARLTHAPSLLGIFADVFTYSMYVVGAALASAMAVGIWHLVDALIRLARRAPYDDEPSP
ncbi:MAG: hypothetical protein HYY84_17740 [Deltaproteobacteria bacterium]|nr:hypothetical protein [Deltaproteobacteria bacterium]